MRPRVGARKVSLELAAARGPASRSSRPCGGSSCRRRRRRVLAGDRRRLPRSACFACRHFRRSSEAGRPAQIDSCSRGDRCSRVFCRHRSASPSAASSRRARMHLLVGTAKADRDREHCPRPRGKRALGDHHLRRHHCRPRRAPRERALSLTENVIASVGGSDRVGRAAPRSTSVAQIVVGDRRLGEPRDRDDVAGFTASATGPPDRARDRREELGQPRRSRSCARRAPATSSGMA